MIDFSLSEEQKALVETARRFTKERITPVAAEADRESRFPMEVFKDAWEIGLVNTDLPRRVRRHRDGRARERAHHRGAGLRLHRHPDEHHRQRPGAHADQARRHRGAEEEVLRHAHQRADHGELRHHASPTPAATSPGCKTRFAKHGDDYVLNGQKCWITNASYVALLRDLRDDRTPTSATRASPRSSSTATPPASASARRRTRSASAPATPPRSSSRT